MGILLAHHILQPYKGPQPPAPLSRLAMLSSVVSSKMLHSMAQREGFRHVETLTGFKWMGNRSLELVDEGLVVPYAFEEAIGYMFTEIVRDKDGVAAATVFLALVAELYARGRTVIGLLEELYQRFVAPVYVADLRYGYFASQNSYVICEDPKVMTMAFYQLRHSTASGISYINNFDGVKVERIHDVSLDYDSAKQQSLPEERPVLPSAEMITFELENGTVMTLRGSGTEPKLKYYIDTKANSLDEAHAKAKVVERALCAAFRRMRVLV